VDLLESLEVVDASWSIGDGPHSEVVHVCQKAPVVAEGSLRAWDLELILEGGLSVGTRQAAQVSDLLLVGFQVVQFVHFSLPIINYKV